MDVHYEYHEPLTVLSKPERFLQIQHTIKEEFFSYNLNFDKYTFKIRLERPVTAKRRNNFQISKHLVSLRLNFKGKGPKH